MNKIGLKVNGIWCVLPQDVSISIEEQNPLFSDSGSFSYPIELSISQNRELFKSIDSPHGRIRPQDLDGLPFELWFDGVMLLYGSTETDEDLDIDEDKCSINLVSGNGDFQSKIEGMQCTDVPLVDKNIHIGYYYPGFTGKAIDVGWDGLEDGYVEFDGSLDPSNNMMFIGCNVSDPYPKSPYCNMRVCVKRKEDWGTAVEKPYFILEANRPWSGMCFYVAYFFKCLFAHLGCVVEEDRMGSMGDMYRLAFVTTKCEHRLGEKMSLGKTTRIKGGSHVEAELITDDVDLQVDESFYYKVYPTEKNFPDVGVSEVVESMFNAFGLKIWTDPTTGHVHVVYIKDILRDNEVIDADMHILNKSVSYSKVKGVRLTYGGDEDDTAFHYENFSEKIELVYDYKKLVKKELSPFDKTLYINPNTGNRYRVKIDKEAEEEGKKDELFPVLFEVGQFDDYVVGEDCEDAVKLKIGFTPLIENDTTSRKQGTIETERTQCLALYVDGAEVDKPREVHTQLMGNESKLFGVITTHTYWVRLKQQRFINFSEERNENPITAHDCGFMLGVMRGPGSRSGYSVQIPDYDGNGNSAWVPVEDDYAFTADTMDAYGNHYDYNGTSDGIGVPISERISLKTHIPSAEELGLKDASGKPLYALTGDAAKRGLADRFMSEYMYFLLHRKTVSMDVDTTLSQLTSLSWFKQLRISDTVGRLKSRSYTLTNSGVSDMSIELYTIN